MACFCVWIPKTIEALDQKFRRRTLHCGIEISEERKTLQIQNIWCLESF